MARRVKQRFAGSGIRALSPTVLRSLEQTCNVYLCLMFWSQTPWEDLWISSLCSEISTVLPVLGVLGLEVLVHLRIIFLAIRAASLAKKIFQAYKIDRNRWSRDMGHCFLHPLQSAASGCLPNDSSTQRNACSQRSLGKHELFRSDTLIGPWVMV